MAFAGFPGRAVRPSRRYIQQGLGYLVTAAAARSCVAVCRSSIASAIGAAMMMTAEQTAQTAVAVSATTARCYVAAASRCDFAAAARSCVDWGDVASASRSCIATAVAVGRSCIAAAAVVVMEKAGFGGSRRKAQSNSGNDCQNNSTHGVLPQVLSPVDRATARRRHDKQTKQLTSSASFSFRQIATPGLVDHCNVKYV